MFNINFYPLSKSWSDFPRIVNEALANLKEGAIIVEIYGGANPYLTRDQVLDYQYTVIELDGVELLKAKGEYFEP